MPAKELGAPDRCLRTLLEASMLDTGAKTQRKNFQLQVQSSCTQTKEGLQWESILMANETRRRFVISAVPGMHMHTRGMYNCTMIMFTIVLARVPGTNTIVHIPVTPVGTIVPTGTL